MSRGLHELQQFPFMKGEPPYWLASASHVMSALMCIDWEFPETTPLSDAIQSVNPLTVNGIAVAGIWLDLPLGLFRSVFHSLLLSFFLCLSEAIGNCKTTDCQPLKCGFHLRTVSSFLGWETKAFGCLGWQWDWQQMLYLGQEHHTHSTCERISCCHGALLRPWSERPQVDSQIAQPNSHTFNCCQQTPRDLGEQHHPAYHSTVWHSIKCCHGFMCNIMWHILLCNTPRHYIVTFHNIVMLSMKQCMHI